MSASISVDGTALRSGDTIHLVDDEQHVRHFTLREEARVQYDGLVGFRTGGHWVYFRHMDTQYISTRRLTDREKLTKLLAGLKAEKVRGWVTELLESVGEA